MFLTRTLTLLVLLLCACTSTSTFDRDRKRRILYNDAASQQSHSYLNRGEVTPYTSLIHDIKDVDGFLDIRTRLTFNTQVDTYLYHIGNGANPPYNIPTEMLWPCFKSYEEVRDAVIAECHANGMEVWATLRMNDLHAAHRSRTTDELDDPFKVEHPEFLMAPASAQNLPRELTEQRLWAGLNYAHSEVRQHRLDFIEKTATVHDFDGYHLDFSRMGLSFPLGEEREHAHLLTDLIRQVRQRLDRVGKSRGRPYTLAVHVMDSFRTSLELGMEVERWTDEGLVDVLIVGLGYLPSLVPIEEWLELGKRHDVQIYPSMNANAFRWGPWGEIGKRPVYTEAMRGQAARFLAAGADGIYIFNFADEPFQRVTNEKFRATLSELGDLSTLSGKDKFYSIGPTSDTGGPFYHGTEYAPLPIVLDRVERKLHLNIGPDGNDPRAHFRISLWTAGVVAETRVWVRLNHKLLGKPDREGPWLHVDVPAGVMRAGANELGLISNVPSGGPFRGIISKPTLDPAPSPMIVHQVLVAATYSENADPTGSTR